MFGDAGGEIDGDEGETDAEAGSDGSDFPSDLTEVPDDASDGDGWEPGCPVFASTVPVGPAAADGSRERPFVGVQSAVDGRETCDRIVLLQDASGRSFDAFVDVYLESGERLTIEGDPTAVGRPELSSVGELPGLRATGDGTLVLRRLAIRGGHAGTAPGADPDGGCLNALVGRLELEDTAWSDCTAAGNGGAVFFVSVSLGEGGGLHVRDSSFENNAAGSRAGSSGGAVAFDAAREDAAVVVEASRFRGNRAASGGAVALLGMNLATRIEHSWFIGNEADSGGTAVSGFQGGRIEGNRFDGNVGRPGAGAVYGTATTYAELIHNLFVANRASGTDGPCGPPAASIAGTGLVFANNVVAANVAEVGSEDHFRCEAGAVAVGSYAVIHNNTFWENVGERGVAHLRGADFDLRNNIFLGGSGETAGVFVEEGGAGTNLIEYNAVWRLPAPSFSDGAALGAGNVEADCALRAPESDDYGLAPGSPCIDAGDPAPELSDPDGTRGDIGAFGGADGSWRPLSSEERP